MENTGKYGAVQDTSNPVFDATVNLLMSVSGTLDIGHIALVHKALLEIYNKEPRRSGAPAPKGSRQMNVETNIGDR